MKKVSSKNYSIHYRTSNWENEKIIMLCNKKKNKCVGFRYANVGDFNIKGKYLIFSTPQNFDAMRLFMNDNSDRFVNLVSDMIEVI